MRNIWPKNKITKEYRDSIIGRKRQAGLFLRPLFFPGKGVVAPFSASFSALLPLALPDLPEFLNFPLFYHSIENGATDNSGKEKWPSI